MATDPRACTNEALLARIEALTTLVNEREDRTKERFTQMKAGVDAALAAADRAVTKAEQATERRFEGVNEFRQTLADQSATLLTRTEFQVQYKAIIDKIELMEKLLSSLQLSISSVQQRAIVKNEGLSVVGQIALGGIAALAAIAAVITALTHFLK